ncbi:hypothetical protein SCP_1303220 [Sparassis crispa]|uniref:Uncharacterized protein n=1 Tax=Sparassis crispa TaxID=139825 RepID=A0A401H229_9APHY|nr:hypothetical protein SCP_1303220 [Sparassis crispa]GBE88506.1 hypothetical protein SCP_1303220 [Sparassis crispa]
MPSLTVNSDGVELYYYDSGVPKSTESNAPYKTLFVVHGWGLNGPCDSTVSTRPNRDLQTGHGRTPTTADG